MRSGLLTNPKVIRMARFLAADRCFMDWWTRGTNKTCDESVYELCDVTVVTRVTVGSLLSVWAAANEAASKGGKVRGVSFFEVDEMAGVPSFGKAMALVGWINELEDGIEFVNFDEHNTIGKDRSSGAKTGAQRTKEYRDRKRAESDENVTRHGDVTVTSQRDHREEKRREEEIHPKSLPGFVTFWASWPKSSRKGGKAECEKLWRTQRLEDLAQVIVEHVKAMAKTEGWTKQGGEFIPAPLVYLRGKRWDGAEVGAGASAAQVVDLWEA